MSIRRKIGLFLILVGVCMRIDALDNGLALTPPMGWNPWSEFKTTITEAVFREMADSMVSRGFLDAGYNYMNQDGAGRYTNSKVLGDWLRSKGFKFGVYGNNVNYTRSEEDWVRRWIDAGADYVKWDAYNSPHTHQSFANIRDLLAASGRNVVYSAHAQPYVINETVVNTVNLMRTGPDIYIPWEEPRNLWGKLMYNIVQNNTFAQHARPGYWNDPDFLMVGLADGWEVQPPKLTYEENRTHFSLWCIAAAPLIIGTDVRKMSKENVEILLNREAIAINQDSLGYQGRRVRRFGDTELWVKNLKNGDKAVLALNPAASERSMTVRWSDVGLSGVIKVRDIWKHEDLGTIADSMDLTLPGRDCRMFRVSGTAVGIERPATSGRLHVVQPAQSRIVNPFNRSMPLMPGTNVYTPAGRSAGSGSVNRPDIRYLLISGSDRD